MGMEDVRNPQDLVEHFTPESDFDRTIRIIAETLKGNIEDLTPEGRSGLVVGEPQAKVVTVEGPNGVYKGTLTVDWDHKNIHFIPYGPEYRNLIMSKASLLRRRISLGEISLENVNRVVCNLREGVVSFVSQEGENAVVLKIDSECNFDFSKLDELTENRREWRMWARNTWE